MGTLDFLGRISGNLGSTIAYMVSCALGGISSLVIVPDDLRAGITLITAYRASRPFIRSILAAWSIRYGEIERLLRREPARELAIFIDGAPDCDFLEQTLAHPPPPLEQLALVAVEDIWKIAPRIRRLRGGLSELDVWNLMERVGMLCLFALPDAPSAEKPSPERIPQQIPLTVTTPKDEEARVVIKILKDIPPELGERLSKTLSRFLDHEELLFVAKKIALCFSIGKLLFREGELRKSWYLRLYWVLERGRLTIGNLETLEGLPEKRATIERKYGKRALEELEEKGFVLSRDSFVEDLRLMEARGLLRLQGEIIMPGRRFDGLYPY